MVKAQHIQCTGNQRAKRRQWDSHDERVAERWHVDPAALVVHLR